MKRDSRKFVEMKREFPEQARIFLGLGLDPTSDFHYRKMSGLIMLRHEAETKKMPVYVDRLTATDVMRLPGVITAIKPVLRENRRTRKMEIAWDGERHAVRCSGCNQVYDEADAHLEKGEHGRALCRKHGDRTEPVILECFVKTRNQRVSATHLRLDGEDVTLSSVIHRHEAVEALPASNESYAPLVYDGKMVGVPLPTQLLVTFVREDDSLAAYVLPADLVDARARGYYADPEDVIAPIVFYRTPHRYMKDGHEVETFRPKAFDGTGKPIELQDPIPEGLMGKQEVRLTERLDRYEAALVSVAKEAPKPQAVVMAIGSEAIAYDGIRREVYAELDALPGIRGSRDMSAATLLKLRDRILPQFDPEVRKPGRHDLEYAKGRHAILSACFEKAIGNAQKREAERATRTAEEEAEEAIGSLIDGLPEPKANES